MTENNLSINDDTIKLYREDHMDKDAHFVILEVVGDRTAAEDFVSTVEKLEHKDLASSCILSLDAMAFIFGKASEAVSIFGGEGEA